MGESSSKISQHEHHRYRNSNILSMVSALSHHTSPLVTTGKDKQEEMARCSVLARRDGTMLGLNDYLYTTCTSLVMNSIQTRKSRTEIWTRIKKGSGREQTLVWASAVLCWSARVTPCCFIFRGWSTRRGA